MTSISTGELVVALAPGVSLSAPHLNERVVNVPNHGSFRVDAETFDFLEEVRQGGQATVLIDPATLSGPRTHIDSLLALRSHRIVELSGSALANESSPPLSEAHGYAGEMADLLVRRDVEWLTRLLSAIGRPLSRVWILPIVTTLCALLPAVLLAGALIFNFQSAYRAWFDYPIQTIALSVVATGISGILHEAGHVAAARRYGVEDPTGGIGFYVHRPVFYVDVTAIDTHPKRDRVHVDLGGIAMDGLLLLLAIVVVRLAFPNSSVAYAVIAALAAASLPPLNPATKSDLNWAMRDALGARGLTASWGRPRALVRAALSARDARERRFARLLLLSTLAAMSIGVVALARSAAAIAPIVRQVMANPVTVVPVALAWLVMLLGLRSSLRAVRRHSAEAII